MLITKYISPIIFGIFILFFSFESSNFSVNELIEKNTEEKEIEEELDENHLHFTNECLKTFSTGGGATLAFTCLFAPNTKLVSHSYPQETKNIFKTQDLENTFQIPLYITFCSLKLDYC